MSWNDARGPSPGRCEMCEELFAPEELTFHYGLRLCDDCLEEDGYEMWPDHELSPPGMSDG